MSDIQLNFIILKSIEAIVFLLYGKILSHTKTSRDYWKKAFVPILTYSLIEGLRFGRYIDWNLYYFRYQSLGENINSEDYEIIFRLICHLSYQIGIPYFLFITFQCTFLITSVFLLLKNFQNKIYFIVPIIITGLMPNEMFIRWYLAFSFMLISIHYIINNNKIKSYIFIVCASLTHIGFLMFIPFLFFYKVLNKYTIPPKISSIVFIISSLILTISSLSSLTYISDFLLTIGIGNINDKMSTYLEDTEDLISGNWGKVGIMEQSIATRIRDVIALLPAIYFGKKTMTKYKYGFFIYNMFVLGAIINPLFQLVEILNRIASSLRSFSIICCGIVYYEYIIVSKKYKIFICSICILSFLCAVWPHVSDIFKRTEKYTMFIWDANGKNYLNK